MKTQSSPATLPEVKNHQKTKPNETAQDNRIPPLLGPDFAHQVVHTRYLTGSANNTTVNAREGLTLHAEVLINGISLAQHAVNHIVTVVNAATLLEHVLLFSCTWVRCAIGVNV